MNKPTFQSGQRVMWTAKDGSAEYGTIEDFLTKARNPHLEADSYLLTMDFNGQTVAVNATNNGLRSAEASGT